MDSVEIGSIAIGSSIILILLGATAVKSWKERIAEKEIMLQRQSRKELAH